VTKPTVARFGAPKLKRAWNVATQTEQEELLRTVAPEAVARSFAADKSPGALERLLLDFAAQAQLAPPEALSSEALDRRRHAASEIKRRLDELCGTVPPDDGVSIPSTLQDLADERPR